MVEFAIVAPLFILLLLGIGDVASTTLAKFRSSNATQSAADLATQSINLQAGDMVDIFSGASSVMPPFPTNPLTLRITSVASDGNGTAFVHWSCGQSTLPPYAAKSSVTTVPTGSSVDTLIYRTKSAAGGYNLNGTNTSFIMVESIYTYNAPAKLVVTTPQIMLATFYTLPRQAAYVGFPWYGIPAQQPTAPASATTTSSTTLSNGVICNYAL